LLVLNLILINWIKILRKFFINKIRFIHLMAILMVNSSLFLNNNFIYVWSIHKESQIKNGGVI
jgi:hypothetical protein